MFVDNVASLDYYQHQCFRNDMESAGCEDLKRRLAAGESILSQTKVLELPLAARGCEMLSFPLDSVFYYVHNT